MTTSERVDVIPGAPLAPRTSLALGGPAEYLTDVACAANVSEVLDWAARRGLPVTLLGGGSNVVVADAGVPGLVVLVGERGESVRETSAGIEVTVGAGEAWDPFVASCVARGWAGLECLSGIPGRVGATPIQNVGAYGQDVSQCLVSVDVFDRNSGSRRTLSHAECGFAYRHSRFKSTDADRFIVLAVTFALRPGGEPCLDYPEIAQKFAASARPTLEHVRQRVLDTRRAKSMVLDPNDENARSCGSFFLNPELEASAFDALAGRTPEPPPGYRQADGRVKVPAAWLIERAGFQRGQRFGSVGISSRHALALVCHPGATAAQVVAAAHRVRDGVERAFGVRLVPEPRFFGFGTPSDRLPAL
jgi:UDP-N-acetylmuramate dehydrogenase